MIATDVLDEVYAAFADEPRPRRIEACHHCETPGSLDALTRRQVRELSAAELAPYAASAPLTVGSWADLRWFLPRIWELLVMGELDWPDPQVMAERVARSENETADPLSQRQSAALTGLRRDWWRIVLSNAPGASRHTPVDVLATMALAGDDLVPVLQEWLALRDEAAYDWLVDFIHVDAPQLAAGRALDAYTRELGWLPTLLTQWSEGPEVADRLDAGQSSR